MWIDLRALYEGLTWVPMSKGNGRRCVNEPKVVGSSLTFFMYGSNVSTRCRVYIALCSFVNLDADISF